LLEEIFKKKEGNFRGLLSAIYVGDELVAAHFGMLGMGVLHWWFPVYNIEYRKYSPGVSLLLSVAEEAKDNGIHCIDLGKGEAQYKDRLCNDEIEIFEGEYFNSLCCEKIHQLKKYINSAPRRTGLAKVLNLPRSILGRWDNYRRYV
jgi:hypothetical protein